MTEYGNIVGSHVFPDQCSLFFSLKRVGTSGVSTNDIDNGSPVRCVITSAAGMSVTGGMSVVEGGAGVDSSGPGSTSIFCSGSVTTTELAFGFGLFSASPSS